MGALSPRAIAAMEPDLDRAGRPAARRHRRQGRRRPDRGFRGRDPGRDDRQPARRAARRARAAARLVAGDPRRARAGDLAPRRCARQQGGGGFLAYLETLVERRRAKPGDPERDVLTRLIQGEDDGERLTREGAAAQLHLPAQRRPRDHDQPDRQRLVALLGYPDQKQRLIDDPELIKTAVEEILRFESSNQLGNRMTTERSSSAASRCDAGTPVTLCIGAANRDPAQFPDPETPRRRAARRTGISPSPPARINAPAWRWRGSKARSRSRASSRASRTMRVSGEPVRGGRVRFRGFLSVPCSIG